MKSRYVCGAVSGSEISVVVSGPLEYDNRPTCSVVQIDSMGIDDVDEILEGVIDAMDSIADDADLEWVALIASVDDCVVPRSMDRQDLEDLLDSAGFEAFEGPVWLRLPRELEPA